MTLSKFECEGVSRVVWMWKSWHQIPRPTAAPDNNYIPPLACANIDWIGLRGFLNISRHRYIFGFTSGTGHETHVDHHPAVPRRATEPAGMI